MLYMLCGLPFVYTYSGTDQSLYGENCNRSVHQEILLWAIRHFLYTNSTESVGSPEDRFSKYLHNVEKCNYLSEVRHIQTAP
jgi:hypothetical protein